MFDSSLSMRDHVNQVCKNNDLCVPKTKRKTLGSRDFTYATPSVWNSLPKNLKLCDSLITFKSLLKTYLFSEAYNV